MKISKILNTNVVLSKNSEGEDIIVLGRGIAFGKTRGDIIATDKIEKIFTEDVFVLTEKFKKLINSIPVEYFDMAEKIIIEASLQLGKTYNDDLYIALTDHIYFAVQRFSEGLLLTNRLFHEIKVLYKEEYNFSLYALDLINEEFKVNLPKDEAAFIALHLVNANLDGDMQDTMQMTKVVNSILHIIKEYFNMKLDEDSLLYYRLITHLKYFSQRILINNSAEESEKVNPLYDVVKEKYLQSFLCVEEISAYVLTNYGYEVSKDDQLYLAIHIERLTNL